MNKTVYALFLMSLVLLSSCGFHLRGEIALPPLFDKVMLVDRGVADFVRPVQQALIENKATLVESSQDATAILSLLSKGVNRRAVAIRGKEVKEYELQISVSFVVHNQQGKQVGKAQTITSVRRYSYNSNRVLGSENEEAIISAEMREDIVHQIVRRLSKY